MKNNMNDDCAQNPAASLTHSREVVGTGVLNGGLAFCPYNVNQILLTSDLMPVALLSDPMIRIPLS